MSPKNDNRRNFIKKAVTLPAALAGGGTLLTAGNTMAQELLPAKSADKTIRINVTGIASRGGALVNYVTPKGNKPHTHKNTLYIWKTANKNLPWGTSPDRTVSIKKDNPVGSQKLNFPFEVGQGYVIGYSVSNNPNMTCATVYIPPNGLNDPTKHVPNHLSIETTYFGNNIVQTRYDGLENYNPKTNKNWIGIWQNNHVSYKGDAIAIANINRQNSEGMATIESVPIRTGSVYTVGYFMAEAPGGRTALATSTTFRT